MAESFALARFKARLTAPPKPRARQLTPEERAALLMRAVTMAEIRQVAAQLDMSFGAAYRERRRLYARTPVSDWPDILMGRYSRDA
jgi:hypothetical protein